MQSGSTRRLAKQANLFGCPRRPSGNTRPVPATRRSTGGAMTSGRTARCGPTVEKAAVSGPESGPCRWALFRPTLSGSTTARQRLGVGGGRLARTYDRAPDDGQAWIDEPRGAGRVLRGGGWNIDAHDCRSANRRPTGLTTASPMSAFASPARCPWPLSPWTLGPGVAVDLIRVLASTEFFKGVF